MRIIENRPLFSLLLLLSTIVFLWSGHGPDYRHYQQWAEALLLKDATSISSTTVSPSGMPVSQWGHGTGVVLGIFHLLSPSFFSAALSAQCVGVVLFLLSSLSLWGVLDAVGLEHRLKLLVYSLFLAGTNFGYYFISLSSEAVTSTVIMVLSWMVLARNRTDFVSAVALAVGSCILLTSRPLAILAMLPIFGVFAWREFQNRDIARAALFFGVIGLGLSVGVLQVMQVNQWMTGSWFHSPLSFGDGAFQSLGEPRFAVAERVLLNHRVGLLISTPLVVLGFFASIGLSFRKSLPAEWRLFFGLACLVNVANLVIISGYYAWSGGLSFGSRYFIPSGLLLFLALPMTLKEARGRHVAALPLVLSLLAIPTVVALNGAGGAFFAGLMALAAWAILRTRHPPDCSQAMLAVTVLSTAILAEFCVFAVIPRSHDTFLILDSWSPTRLWGVALVLVFLAALSVNTYVNREGRHSGFDSASIPVGIAAVGLALVLFQAMKFVEFRSATEDYRRAQIARPDASFKFRATFEFDNFSADVDGWDSYEWSDREIALLRAFRDRTREAIALKRP